MGVLNDIREVIREIAAQESEQRTPFHVGTVKSVSDDGETCSVEFDGAEWTDVRLTAVTDGSCDVKMYPKVNSYVIVADLSNGSLTDLVVVTYSQFDRIELGEAKHTSANADTLKDELTKLTKRVDILYDAIRNGVPTAQDGGAALQKTMVAILETATDKESWNDIEDKNIMH